MLRQARAAKGMTQRALGDRVGLPQSHVSKIEQGIVDLQLSSLSEIARALDLELKLVPRRALPAVEGLVQSLAPDPLEAGIARARATWADHQQLAAEIRQGYPTLLEGRRFAELVDALQGLRIDPATLKILDEAVFPATRKIRAHLGASADDARLTTALVRANTALRTLASAQTHGLLPQFRQEPALRLDADDD